MSYNLTTKDTKYIFSIVTIFLYVFPFHFFYKGINLEPGMRCASFDGDGDRIVYYYKTSEGKFCLLDGDKIATLVSTFIFKRNLKKQAQGRAAVGRSRHKSHGVIQY